MKTLALLACLLLSSCTDPVQTNVRIVDIYRTGFGFRFTVTVVEMADGTRRELPGRLGKEGETVSVWIEGDDISVSPPGGE